MIVIIVRLLLEIPVGLPESEMAVGAGHAHDLPVRTVTGATVARAEGRAGYSSPSSTPLRSRSRANRYPFPLGTQV